MVLFDTIKVYGNTNILCSVWFSYYYYNPKHLFN